MGDTGENPTQLDAKAQVLLNTGDRAGALVLWGKALAAWEPSRFGAGLEITFAARNAGIAAAHLGQWNGRKPTAFSCMHTKWRAQRGLHITASACFPTPLTPLGAKAISQFHYSISIQR